MREVIYTQDEGDLMVDGQLVRFKRSMEIDYEKWHDGVGYDIEALRQLSGSEREEAEKIILNRGPLDWRDIEALSVLNTPKSNAILRKAAKDPDPEVRMAVIAYSPKNVTYDERVSSIVKALRTAQFYHGLSQTLDQVEHFHPNEVIEELLRGALNREGEVAVHFAARLFYIYGKADSSFDMKHRSFFLRFNTKIREDRRKVFKELCEIIGVDFRKYLR
jgi:hypothetical protein